MFASRGLIIRSLFVFGIIGSIASNVEAQQWANKLFSQTHHDFGTVGRNSKAEHLFEFENNLESDMRITSIRSSCGCTKATIAKNIIRPGEKGQIQAVFNTKSFIGHKQAVITLVIDRPYYAEVQLTVTGNIRSDIVTEPGEVRFGDVDMGQSRETVVRISYSGRPDWKITDVRGTCDHLEVRMEPPVRQGQTVIYTLRVRLRDDAPPGDVSDELSVVTNDTKSEYFVMPVSGRVLAPVSITPQLVSLGKVGKGTATKQKFLVRASKPFGISEIVCEDERFTFQAPAGEKTVHVVPFEFRGESGEGEFRQPILVKTSLGEKISAECIISGEVH